MNNIFRGEILREVKKIPETGQWVVNGKIIKKEGLSETEKLTLESYGSGNWKLLKGEAHNNGNLIC